jgi:hypothetical protein
MDGNARACFLCSRLPVVGSRRQAPNHAGQDIRYTIREAHQEYLLENISSFFRQQFSSWVATTAAQLSLSGVFLPAFFPWPVMIYSCVMVTELSTSTGNATHQSVRPLDQLDRHPVVVLCAYTYLVPYADGASCMCLCGLPHNGLPWSVLSWGAESPPTFWYGRRRSCECPMKSRTTWHGSWCWGNASILSHDGWILQRKY